MPKGLRKGSPKGRPWQGAAAAEGLPSPAGLPAGREPAGAFPVLACEKLRGNLFGHCLRNQKFASSECVSETNFLFIELNLIRISILLEILLFSFLIVT